MGWELKESKLQKWFVEKVRVGCIGKYICNIAALDRMNCRISIPPLEADRTLFDWLRKAKRTLNSFLASDLITANESIHAGKGTQSRPDLLLRDEDGVYVVVELKTNLDAERQGINEVYAYMHDLYWQVPYQKKIRLVIVAKHWGSALTKATKGAMLAGNSILPLRVVELSDEEIRLEINEEIFKPPRPSPIHAPTALVPYSLALTSESAEKLFLLEKEFQLLACKIQAHCRSLYQTGFVCVWNAQSRASDATTVGITLFTVNPGWMFSEENPSDMKVQKLVEQSTPDFLKRAKNKRQSKRSSDDIDFGENEIYHPPENPSVSILEKLSKGLQRRQYLDWGCDGANFSAYADGVRNGRQWWISKSIYSIGTMRDFFRLRGHGEVVYEYDIDELEELVHLFNDYHAKNYS